jgi:hypothetical protein
MRRPLGRVSHSHRVGEVANGRVELVLRDVGGEVKELLD